MMWRPYFRRRRPKTYWGSLTQGERDMLVSLFAAPLIAMVVVLYAMHR